MGDFQNQQGTEQEDQQVRQGPAPEPEDAATAQVRSMLSSRDPRAIGEVIRNNPESKRAIYALLHKTLGNRFVSQVDQFAVIGTGVQGKAPSEKHKAEAMADFREVDAGPNHAPGTGVAPTEFSQKGRDELPEMLSNLESSSPAAKSDTAAPASGGPSKAQRAAMEIDEYEAELKPKGPSASSKGAGLTAEAQAFGQEPNNAHAVNPNAPPINYEGADRNQHHQYERPKVDQDQLRADLEPSNPVAASKVLKDETVIASSAEVKQPEVVRATEVLKDPNQSEEPQKASDVVKHDDAENEGSGGGAKADAGPVKITASVLRVRSSPKISKANIVGRLTKGDVVEAIGHSGEWVEIKYKGQTAFVHSSFVVSAQETAVAKAPDQGAPATAT